MQKALISLILPQVRAFDGYPIEAMEDNRLPRKGPGRAPNDGNFVLSELEVMTSPSRIFRIGRKWVIGTFPQLRVLVRGNPSPIQGFRCQ